MSAARGGPGARSGRTGVATAALRRVALAAGLAALAALAGCQTDLPLAELKTRWGGPPSRYLPMDGIEVHWRDEGPATASLPGPPDALAARAGTGTDVPAILLLHGTGSSLHTWDGWAERLSPHMRVVRLDLPGFGLTGPHPSGDYSAAATVDFLERFVAAAGLGRFAIAGNSLGGYYAWRFALRHPERVSALVLVDAVGYPVEQGASRSTAMRLARLPVISELMRFLPVEGLIERSLRDTYADPRKVTPELVERYADLMRRPGNRIAFGDRTRADPRPTGWERLTELRVPTLILWGAQDEWVPPSNAERFDRDIPDSELRIYPDLGHLPMEEDPDTTARDVLRFLRERARSGGMPR
ncbi:MAG TPA: alpha/beta hydrolase [Burkholderiaceae bacterium]|nr:alpha/beta hydrolase [Burkholderiaceae bacterium]